MQLALARPLVLPWRRILLALYIGVNLSLIALDNPAFARWDSDLWAAIPRLVATGTLYDHGMPETAAYVWSPIIAPVMAFAGWIGPTAWAALHVAVLALLRDWRLVALVLVSWAFYRDAIYGGPMAFFLVLAVLALRGSRWAGLGYLTLMLMIPRPLYLPVGLWLLWKRPELRTPFVAIFVVHAVAVLFTGQALDWAAAVLVHGGDPPMNLGPTAIFGMAWLLVGVPLGAWLLWKGRVGLAGLAVSPYVLPSYLLWPLVELDD